MDVQRKYFQRHLARLAKYERQVSSIFDKFTKELVKVALTAQGGDELGSEPFTFSRYPLTAKAVQKLMQGFKKELLAAIVNGVNNEWALANRKNDELEDVLFSRLNGQLTEDERRRYYKNHDDALAAYRERVTAGLKLSDRVWRYTEQYKTEIEYGLDCGIRDGVAATRMAEELKQYLQYPDKLFRRVRNQHGQLVLSRAAQAFHPSTGVYRSSYKNALRLARTETNIAYRTADHERWKDLDFVLGFRVNLSNNHTCNGVPLRDICDDLKGEYPKDFKFVGWHPQCRCYVTSILMSDDEIDERRAARRAGKELGESKNLIKDVPQAFKDYVKDRKAKLETAPNPPYWYRDNPQYVGNEQPKPVEKPVHLTALERAEQRHMSRTPEQIADIRQRWRDHRIQQDLDEYVYFPEYPKSGTYEEKQAWVEKAATRLYGKDSGMTKILVTYSPDGIDCAADVYLTKLPTLSKKHYDAIKDDRTYRDVPDDIFLEYRDRLKQYNGVFENKDLDYRLSWAENCIKGFQNITKLHEAGVDWSVVSTKMPVELLADGDWFNGVGSISRKDFFDNEGRIFTPVKITNKKGTSCFSPMDCTVELMKSDVRYLSAHYRETLIYHEFGHAYDWQHGLRKRQEVTDVIDDFAKALKKKCTMPEYDGYNVKWVLYYDRVLSADNSYSYYLRSSSDSEYAKGERERGKLRMEELGIEDPYTLLSQLCNTSDCIGAATNGYHEPAGGHGKKYWTYDGMKQAEVIAHAMEVYYKGNDYMKKVLPDLFDALFKLGKFLVELK